MEAKGVPGERRLLRAGILVGRLIAPGSASRSAAVAAGRSDRGELAEAFAAVRVRLGLVGLLLALAAVAWWSTADRMAGMNAGPGTDLGALGWFLGVWVVMMAAMMFPSLAPTVALYAKMTRRRGTSLAAVHRRLPARLGSSWSGRVWPLPPRRKPVRQRSGLAPWWSVVRGWCAGGRRAV